MGHKGDRFLNGLFGTAEKIVMRHRASMR